LGGNGEMGLWALCHITSRVLACVKSPVSKPVVTQPVLDEAHTHRFNSDSCQVWDTADPVLPVALTPLLRSGIFLFFFYDSVNQFGKDRNAKERSRLVPRAEKLLLSWPLFLGTSATRSTSLPPT